MRDRVRLFIFSFRVNAPTLFWYPSLPYWNEELLIAWDARDSAHKFEIVCIVHNADDVRWQSSIPEWSRRNAIRLLPISEQ